MPKPSVQSVTAAGMELACPSGPWVHSTLTLSEERISSCPSFLEERRQSTAFQCRDPLQDRVGSALPLRFTRIRPNSASKIQMTLIWQGEMMAAQWPCSSWEACQKTPLSSKAVTQVCLLPIRRDEKSQGSKAGGLCVPLIMASTPNMWIDFWNEKSTLIIQGQNCPPFNPEALASAKSSMSMWVPDPSPATSEVSAFLILLGKPPSHPLMMLARLSLDHKSQHTFQRLGQDLRYLLTTNSLLHKSKSRGIQQNITLWHPKISKYCPWHPKLVPFNETLQKHFFFNYKK